MSRLTTSERQAVAALDALYATLPTIACKGLCAIACGPIVLTDIEARRLQVTTHTKPRTIPVTAIDADGNTLRERCVYLTPANRCRAYAVRPLICRAWGLVKMLSCMHGCVPDRWISTVDLAALGQAVERIGGGRVLRTIPEGLGLDTDAKTWGDLAPRRSAAAIARDEDRTRGLRALHGGRIISAVRNDDV
jgi:Fe-S-cluster containining protein